VELPKTDNGTEIWSNCCDVEIGFVSIVTSVIVCWQERGMPVPHPTIHGPSAYIPAEEVSPVALPFVMCCFSLPTALSFYFPACIFQEANNKGLHASSHA
jgi:hypothetical protein